MNQESVSVMFLFLFIAITIAAHIPGNNSTQIVSSVNTHVTTPHSGIDGSVWKNGNTSNNSPGDTDNTTKSPVTKEETIRQQITYHAKSLDGAVYVKSKSDSTATDCSGVVYYSYIQAGVKLSRLSADGYHKLAVPIKREELKPGDIISWESNGKIVHVQVYIGTAMETIGKTSEFVHDAVVNAPEPGKKVYIVSLRKFEEWNKSWKVHYGNLLQKIL